MKSAELRLRLAEAEEALRAIHAGEVDSVVVTGKDGQQVFTLEGEEREYRVLIESMNEGALTLTADKTILYSNECFARMVKCPLEQMTDGSLRRFLSLEEERVRVSRELHDTITQTLCGILVHSQILANGLPARGRVSPRVRSRGVAKS